MRDPDIAAAREPPLVDDTIAQKIGEVVLPLGCQTPTACAPAGARSLANRAELDDVVSEDIQGHVRNFGCDREESPINSR